MAVYHREKYLPLEVHGDDFTSWTDGLMMFWYEIKLRAEFGGGRGDDKDEEVVILERIVRGLRRAWNMKPTRGTKGW